jgi:hypothetical protein
MARYCGRIGYAVLAAVAEGRNPRQFGGADLVAKLVATQRTTGGDAGLFGAGTPTFDGAFRQGVALTALKAAKVPSSDPAVVKGLGCLTSQQCANGLWLAYRADTSVACPAADPATFAGPDTNSTGLAVQGLAAYGKYPQRAKVLASLEAVRSADGGFPFLAAPGQESDPNSTAVTIQAFLAEGASPVPRTACSRATSSAAAIRRPIVVRTSTRVRARRTCSPPRRRFRPLLEKRCRSRHPCRRPPCR